MKKTLLSLVLASTLGVSSCEKEVFPLEKVGQDATLPYNSGDGSLTCVPFDLSQLPSPFCVPKVSAENGSIILGNHRTIDDEIAARRIGLSFQEECNQYRTASEVFLEGDEKVVNLKRGSYRIQRITTHTPQAQFQINTELTSLLNQGDCFTLQDSTHFCLVSLSEFNPIYAQGWLFQDDTWQEGVNNPSPRFHLGDSVYPLNNRSYNIHLSRNKSGLLQLRVDDGLGNAPYIDNEISERDAWLTYAINSFRGFLDIIYLRKADNVAGEITLQVFPDVRQGLSQVVLENEVTDLSQRNYILVGTSTTNELIQRVSPYLTGRRYELVGLSCPNTLIAVTSAKVLDIVYTADDLIHDYIER